MNTQQTILTTIEQLLEDGRKENMISYKEIITKAGYCRNVVINSIKLLCAMGLLEINKPPTHKYQGNLPNCYRILKK